MDPFRDILYGLFGCLKEQNFIHARVDTDSNESIVWKYYLTKYPPFFINFLKLIHVSWKCLMWRRDQLVEICKRNLIFFNLLNLLTHCLICLWNINCIWALTHTFTLESFFFLSFIFSYFYFMNKLAYQGFTITRNLTTYCFQYIVWFWYIFFWFAKIKAAHEWVFNVGARSQLVN